MACHLDGTKPLSSNQYWNIVNWTLRNKLQWNFNRNSNMLIQENAHKNVVCEMMSILSRSQCVKWRGSCHPGVTVYRYARWANSRSTYITDNKHRIQVTRTWMVCTSMIMARLPVNSFFKSRYMVMEKIYHVLMHAPGVLRTGASILWMLHCSPQDTWTI